MENKPVLDPQLEEEKVHNRKNQFFARLAGALTAVASGFTSGYYFVKESLLNRVRAQINMNDWSPHINAGKDAFPIDEKELFAASSRSPDLPVQYAIHDIYEHNPSFVRQLGEKFHSRVNTLKESREKLLNEVKNDFIATGEDVIRSIESKNPRAVDAIRAEMNSIKAEFERISGLNDPASKHRSIRALIERLNTQYNPEFGRNYGNEAADEGITALRAAGVKLHEKLSKHYNNFLYLVDSAKKELIDTPIFKELLKADNRPGHMGLGFRHADGKGVIFLKSGAIAVSMGAIAWGGARLLQLFHDRSDLQEQRGHLKTEMAKREAAELENFENHARA